MSITNTAIWHEESKRRKRILKLLAIIAFIGLASLISLWAIITQPIFSSLPHNPQIIVNSERLKTHVKVISQDIFPRNESHPENLNKVADYIKNEFSLAKGAVTEQRFEVNGKVYKNIVADFGPATNEIIVVGAHYDAAGERPAADDNASGIAALIELAHLLSTSNLTMRTELVAFTLEEPPFFRTKFMGSALHANSLKARGLNVKMMFSLEMIGFYSNLPNSQNYPLPLLELFYPTRGNFITIIGTLGNGLLVRQIKKAMIKAGTLPVYSMNAPTAIPGIDFSDQLNYWNEGYDAVMITDTAFYRNKNYHTMNDTAEKLDYVKIAIVTQDIYAAILELEK
jgi:hypothetical protein